MHVSKNSYTLAKHIIKDNMKPKIENNMDRTKDQIKSFFKMAQELQELATEGDDDFLHKVIDVESELDEDDDFLLCDVIRFASDVQSAIEEDYDNLIDYMDDHT